MSSLTENLQQIYSIKQEIKEVIGTNSDLFEHYPAYIAAAIEAGGEIPAGYTYVSGTYNITANGTGIDISSYASVDVAVPIPAGYIVPAGTKSIASNGSNIDVTAYAAVNVAVPVPAGYIQPSGTITIDDNEIGNNVDVSSYQYAYIDIQGGGGSAKGDPADMFVSIRPGYSGLSNYPYFYDQWIDTGNSDNSVDGSVTVHTLISDGFPSWGIDTNDFVSSIKKFEVYDWNSGNPAALYDLTCTTMVQEYSSNYDCWCLVEGTLQSATNVCFKSDNGSWDDMSSQWSMDNNWTLMEYMPVVDNGYVMYEGTYISLPAGEVCMYLHYQGSDGDACNVYIRVYDEQNQMWTDKWKAIEYTDQTFVNPNANE